MSKSRSFLKPILIAGAVLVLSSCSIVPQGNYTALAEKERQLVTEWPVQEAGAEKATVLKELISDPCLMNRAPDDWRVERWVRLHDVD